MDVQTLYRDELLEHYRNPQNFGKIPNFSVCAKQSNPFCGDDIEIFVQFEKDKIKNIGFVGRGCAISMAGGSMLTEFVIGKTKKELTNFGEKAMLVLLGVEVSETRKKCALLAFSVLKDCIYGTKSKS